MRKPKDLERDTKVGTAAARSDVQRKTKKLWRKGFGQDVMERTVPPGLRTSVKEAAGRPLFEGSAFISPHNGQTFVAIGPSGFGVAHDDYGPGDIRAFSRRVDPQRARWFEEPLPATAALRAVFRRWKVGPAVGL